MRSFSKFFSPEPPKKTQAELAAEERRVEVSIAAEQALPTMRLSVLAGEGDDGAPMRRAAPISVLQSQAEQNLAIFGAVREQALMDLLLSMRISAREFSDRNILVVPALVSVSNRSLLDLSAKLMRSKFMSQGSIALPSAVSEEDRGAWGELLAAEFDEADEQGLGDQAASQGLAVLVRRTGEIVRRGVGRPDWQVIFDELGI